MRPLQDLFLLDLSTLLPGPIATLLLAEAGTDVVKIYRPLLDEAFLQAQRGASGRRSSDAHRSPVSNVLGTPSDGPVTWRSQSGTRFRLRNVRSTSFHNFNEMMVSHVSSVIG